MQIPHAHPSDPPLWHFSLRFYAQPGIATACLALQNDCDADVNLLLCALWLGSIRRMVSIDQLQTLDQGVARWRCAAVRPLRAIRSALRHEKPLADQAGIDRLRDQIKALELQAEKLQQFELARLVQALEAAPGAVPAIDASASNAPMKAAETNLDVYQTMLGCEFPSSLRQILLTGLADVLASPNP